MECMPTTLSKNRNRNRKVPLKPTPKPVLPAGARCVSQTPIVMMMLLKEDRLSLCQRHTGVCDGSRKQDPVVVRG
jgi:hypothetical protein